MLLPLVASNTEQYSFFARTKGTSRLRCDNENVKQWVDSLYRHNLPVDLSLLKAYATLGCFRLNGHPLCPGSGWHYSGTFFWINHRRVFVREWRKPNDTRYAGEGWLGRFIPVNESYCLYGLNQGGFYHSPPPFDQDVVGIDPQYQQKVLRELTS